MSGVGPKGARATPEKIAAVARVAAWRRSEMVRLREEAIRREREEPAGETRRTPVQYREV